MTKQTTQSAPRDLSVGTSTPVVSTDRLASLAQNAEGLFKRAFPFPTPGSSGGHGGYKHKPTPAAKPTPAYSRTGPSWNQIGVEQGFAAPGGSQTRNKGLANQLDAGLSGAAGAVGSGASWLGARGTQGIASGLSGLGVIGPEWAQTARNYGDLTKEMMMRGAHQTAHPEASRAYSEPRAKQHAVVAAGPSSATRNMSIGGEITNDIAQNVAPYFNPYAVVPAIARDVNTAMQDESTPTAEVLDRLSPEQHQRALRRAAELAGPGATPEALEEAHRLIAAAQKGQQSAIDEIMQGKADYLTGSPAPAQAPGAQTPPETPPGAQQAPGQAPGTPQPPAAPSPAESPFGDPNADPFPPGSLGDGQQPQRKPFGPAVGNAAWRGMFGDEEAAQPQQPTAQEPAIEPPTPAPGFEPEQGAPAIPGMPEQQGSEAGQMDQPAENVIQDIIAKQNVPPQATEEWTQDRLAKQVMEPQDIDAAIERIENGNMPEQEKADLAKQITLAGLANVAANSPDSMGTIAEFINKARTDGWDKDDYYRMYGTFADEHGLNPQDPKTFKMFGMDLGKMTPMQQMGLVLGLGAAIGGLASMAFGDTGTTGLLVSLLGAGGVAWSMGAFDKWLGPGGGTGPAEQAQGSIVEKAQGAGKPEEKPVMSPEEVTTLNDANPWLKPYGGENGTVDNAAEMKPLITKWVGDPSMDQQMQALSGQLPDAVKQQMIDGLQEYSAFIGEDRMKQLMQIIGPVAPQNDAIAMLRGAGQVA